MCAYKRTATSQQPGRMKEIGYKIGNWFPPLSVEASLANRRPASQPGISAWVKITMLFPWCRKPGMQISEHMYVCKAGRKQGGYFNSTSRSTCTYYRLSFLLDSARSRRNSLYSWRKKKKKRFIDFVEELFPSASMSLFLLLLLPKHIFVLCFPSSKRKREIVRELFLILFFVVSYSWQRSVALSLNWNETRLSSTPFFTQ